MRSLSRLRVDVRPRHDLAELLDFRADEIAHKNEALAQGAEDAPGYKFFSEGIKAGCRLAIKLSEKI